MSEKEEMLNKLLKEASDDVSYANFRIEDLKRNLIDAETVLIEAKLRHKKLAEELRVYRDSQVDHNMTDRQKEIDDFKNKLPDLMKKFK